MKKIALLAVLAMTASLAAAQPAAKPAAKPAPDKPQAEKAKPAAKAVASAEGRKSKRGEDARHCLDKSSNTEIIKCAEAYL